MATTCFKCSLGLVSAASCAPAQAGHHFGGSRIKHKHATKDTRTGQHCVCSCWFWHALDDVHALALGVLDDRHTNIQGLCTVAWGLAVLDALTLQVFCMIVDKVRGNLGSGTLRIEQRTQLYQALYQLEPSLDRDPAAYRAWQAAARASMVQCTQGDGRNKVSPHNVELNSVCDELGLHYSRSELMQNTRYSAAILHPLAGASRPIMLTVTYQADYFNYSDRLMGAAAFRRKLLGRHAQLVYIPYDELNKAYVKSALEQLTGLPLHTAFATSAASDPGR